MTARGSTPEEYYRGTGETIGQAVERLHKIMGVEHAAHYVGFASSTDLRRYLSRRGIPDPWPLAYRGKRKRHRVSDEDMVTYCRRVLRGEPRGEVERDMGFGACVLAQKLRRVSTERAEAWWAEARILEADHVRDVYLARLKQGKADAKLCAMHSASAGQPLRTP